MPTSAPQGTVTFLFTDIEGSTRLWQEHPTTMQGALMRHDALIRESIEAHGGLVFKTVGDSFCAAFSNAADAVRAAIGAQRALLHEPWRETGPIKVRIALNTGPAERRATPGDGWDYFGQPLN